MRLVPVSLLAGVASLALAGSVAAHTLTVQLPDGTTEQINYAGDVAPQVSLVPAANLPSLDWAPGPPSPFALIQQIAAEMDRESAAMMRAMQTLAVQPIARAGGPIAVDLTNLPPGTQSYSFVSTLSPRGVCSESVQITGNGPGQKPRVVEHRSGNCGPGMLGTTNAAAPDEAPVTPPAQPRTTTYQASAAANSAYARMMHEVSW